MATTSILSTASDDPFSLILAPPAGESLMDRDIRMRKEADAKRRSDAIDEQIRVERELQKKRKNNEVKLLLLGQSSSGKSTLQKQFQLLYAPATLDLERVSWQPVVYVNLVKSVRTILEALEFDFEYDNESEMLNGPISPSTPSPSTSRQPPSTPKQPSISIKGKGRASDDSPPSPTSHSGSPPSSSLTDLAAWPQQLATLRLRLLPLLSMEAVLARSIGRGVTVAPGKEEVFVRHGWQGVRKSSKGSSEEPSSSKDHIDAAAIAVLEEYAARNHSTRRRRSMSSDMLVTPASTTSSEYRYQIDERDEVIRQVSNLLVACKGDVEFLWSHPSVKALIKRRRLRLEESSTFFLDNLDRVAKSEYLPSDDDILRARLRTMGVSEHVFEVPTGSTQRVIHWKLYDVGGARGQRPSWVPYFEDTNAIIFLAPISAFDQYLEEDHKINRVDDSLQLFTLICSNPLLKNVHLVLFLNKTDVLKKKLAMGVKIKKYITSYGERPNEYGAVSSYFVAHFRQVHRKNNIDAKRELYTHLTSVVDTQATRNIIMDVRDAIFRVHLKESSML